MLSIRIPPGLCSNNIFCMFLQCGFRERLEANYREYTIFFVQHAEWQNWVWLGPALGEYVFSSFSRPQFCGIPPCLAHIRHTCPSKRPGQTLAYPRRLQKLNKKWLFDKVLSNDFWSSDPCHCPYLFFRSRTADFSLLINACQRQRIPLRINIFQIVLKNSKLAPPWLKTLLGRFCHASGSKLPKVHSDLTQKTLNF